MRDTGYEMLRAAGAEAGSARPGRVLMYSQRIESFVVVGAASCREGAPVAAGCRSYGKTENHQIETSKRVWLVATHRVMGFSRARKA